MHFSLIDVLLFLYGLKSDINIQKVDDLINREKAASYFRQYLPENAI